jgi:hypothetical protein
MNKTRHDGDCSIYASLDNLGMPEAGICTCGFGHEKLRENGSPEHMYSRELAKELEGECFNRVGGDEMLKLMEQGGWIVKK